MAVSGLGKSKENYNYERDKENPWLVKILYTCFPSNYKEPIRLGDYETREIKFDEAELLEMRTFLKKVLEDTNIEREGKRQLQSGSIFFLKLGEGKSKFLDDGIDKIKSGLSYSFKFLNSLKKIYINGQEIQEQKVDFYDKSYSLESPEFLKINPKNKKREIKFAFAFYKDYRKAEGLRNGLVPNLYTFFSMDEEKNGLNFLLHCNAFDMNNDRRKLQANSQINEKLLPIIANEITQYIEGQKDRNRELFLSLYANLLLSNEPKSKPHINEHFFKFLRGYLDKNIPTQKGYSDNSKNVKIKATSLPINPSDFGCPEIEWFAWQNEKFDKVLIDEARNSEKLHLEKWDIVDLLKYAIKQGHIDKINAWVQQSEIETAQIFAEEKAQKNANHSQELPKRNKSYSSLLHELNDNISKSNTEIISQIKLFKFSDDNYYSLNDIFEGSSLILKDTNVSSIWAILNYKLGLIISHLDISKYKNLYAGYQNKISNLNLFQKIVSRTKEAAQSEIKAKRLYPDDKKNLFLVLMELSKDAEGKIDTKRIRDIEMFSDTQKKVMPLRKLIKGDNKVPNWLFVFKMEQNENLPEVTDYCAKQDEIYKNIILENWENIVSYERLNASYFYPELLEYYKLSKDKELLESKKLPFIATQNGFKKINEVFFSPILKDLEKSKYTDLQSFINTVSQKEMPRFEILSYLIDKESPLRVTEIQSIVDFLETTENLEYYKVEALLAFTKLTKEKIFKYIYIENKNNRFCITKHQQSVFQYYSDSQEVNELLSSHPDFKLLPKEFKTYASAEELGILRDKTLYMKVLQTLDFSENLLPIVQESDREVQLAYLDKLKDFRLQEGKTYDKNSFEHRCLKLAIDCYHDNFQTKFAPKILINGNLRIKDIAVKDDIYFGGVTLSLAAILPNYKGVSDIISKIIKQFTDFRRGDLSEKVFLISDKSKQEVHSELASKFPILENIEQFAFLLYYSKQVGRNLFTSLSCRSLLDKDILQYAYEQRFVELNTYKNLGLAGKIYPSELAFEGEKLHNWVLAWLEGTDKQKKLDFLGKLGVHTENSNVCTVRRFFQTGQNGEIFAIPHNYSVLLINTLKWLQNKVFKASEITKLDALKHIYTRIDYSQEIPLLYVSQITESEIVYKLEVSNTGKYYFETQQKEYLEKVFLILRNKGFKLIALEFFKHWQTSIVSLSKIQTNSQLDLILVTRNSEEWKNGAYEQWKINQKYKIFIYKGEKLPYKTLFLEQEIDTFTEGTSIEKEGIIYVCQSVLHDIRNQLTKYINSDVLIKLYQLENNNSDVVETLKTRISELEKQINLLLGNKSSNWQDSDTFINDSNQVATDREYNLETGYKAEAYVYEQLKNQGFENVVWKNQANMETARKITQLGKTYFIDEKREPYDLTFTDDKGRFCYVQVKGTTTTFDRADDVKMIITKPEWLFLQKNENKDVYYMARVFSARESPTMKFFKMELKIG